MAVIIAGGGYKLPVTRNRQLRLTSVYIIAKLPSECLSVCPSPSVSHKRFFVEKMANKKAFFLQRQPNEMYKLSPFGD
jgi:hypothetical protein